MAVRRRNFASSCGIEASGPYVSSVSPRKPASVLEQVDHALLVAGHILIVQPIDPGLPRFGHQEPALGELLREARLAAGSAAG